MHAVSDLIRSIYSRLICQLLRHCCLEKSLLYDRDVRFLCHTRRIEIIIVVTAADNTVHGRAVTSKKRHTIEDGYRTLTPPLV